MRHSLKAFLSVWQRSVKSQSIEREGKTGSFFSRLEKKRVKLRLSRFFFFRRLTSRKKYLCRLGLSRFQTMEECALAEQSEEEKIFCGLKVLETKDGRTLL